MHWMNPAGAFALVALAAIVVLYILKQRMEPMEVSSTYLWRRAVASMEADRPFQRLRRNLLMFVQLLLVLSLALSIMRPMTLGGEAGEVLFVFDLSASMQATGGEGEPSRLEMAKANAVRRLGGLPDGARISVLTAGSAPAQPLSRTDDRIAARRVIEGLAPQMGAADLDGALSLALALRREIEGAQIVAYTDQAVPTDAGIVTPRIASAVANAAVLSLSADDGAAVARLMAYGAAMEVTVECYQDEELVDVRRVELPQGEIVAARFDLPGAAGTVEAVISEADALLADNTRTWVRQGESTTTVVLAGRDNVFIEKVLGLRSDIHVLRASAQDAASAEAVLTIIDGPLPEVLPETGALLLVDPDRYVGAETEGPMALAAVHSTVADEMNALLRVEEVQIAAWRPVAVGDAIWTADGDAVLTLGTMDERPLAILGFDIHRSNLPLLKEFPVVMERLLERLAPEPLSIGVEGAVAGESFRITPRTSAQSAQMVLPDGETLSLPLTASVFDRTEQLGIYRLRQADAQGDITETPFAVHIPAAESDTATVALGNEAAAGNEGALRYGREWTPWVILLALCLLLLEWGVYRRGV